MHFCLLYDNVCSFPVISLAYIDFSRHNIRVSLRSFGTCVEVGNIISRRLLVSKGFSDLQYGPRRFLTFNVFGMYSRCTYNLTARP